MRKPTMLIMFPTKAMAYTFYLDFFHNLIGDRLVKKHGHYKLEFENYDIILSGEDYSDKLRGLEFTSAYVSDFISKYTVDNFILPNCRMQRERINFV